MPGLIDTEKWLKDGNLTFISGQDGSRNAADIGRDQYASAVNATCRGGNLAPRPGLIRRPLNYASTTVQRFFQRGLFQHGFFYDGNGFPALLSSHSGRQFKVDPSNWTVSEITPTKRLTVTTTVNFTIPAVSSTVQITVTDTSLFYTDLPALVVGGYTLTLVSIDAPTLLTVQNNLSSQVGIVVNQPATVNYYTYDVNSGVKTLGWSVQAINYWIYQDNEGIPIIFDGTSARRANQAINEIPVGNVMAFAFGRLIVALPDRASFRAGDLIYGSSGTLANGYRDAILRFTENTYLNEGGDFVARIFGAPSNSGPITSMKAAAMPDTQLGQGPLIVGTPNMVFTVQLPFDRTTWKNLTQPLQTVVPIKGPTGQSTTVQVNADLWYRAPDSTIRSYILAQRDFSTWGNTGQSSELDDILSADTPALLENGSAVLFDNRLLVTVSPQMSPNGVYHRGLAALDFNLVSTIRQKAPPAWDGVWSVVQILQIVSGIINGQERCFIYALNQNNHIELWELSSSAKTDDGNPINWSIELPSYNCGDSDEYKKLEYGRFVLQNLNGTLTWSVQYRTDASPCYHPWDSGSVCSLTQDCGPDPCTGPITYRTQSRTPIKLHTPPDSATDFDPISNRLLRAGYEFQPMISFVGWAEMRQFRIYCKPESEPVAREETDS